MPYSGSIWKATTTTCPFLRPRDLKALANLLVSLTTSANVIGSFHCKSTRKECSSFKIEIEASVTARNKLDLQEARDTIDKARQWLYQKTDEFKTEEDAHENKGLTVSMPIASNSKLNFFRCSPSDPEAMGADHHKFSLQGGTGKLLNTALGISEDTFLLTVVISGNTTGDQDQGNSYSVLIVDGDLTDRDTIRRYTMSVGTERQLTMEFQEAKNAKEAVFLHLAGASFDLIIMDEQMPIMAGIQATQLLRKMGVKSQIVGGADECLENPLDTA